MNWTLRQLIVVGAFLASALSFRQAPAADIPCGPAQEGVIFLDGLFTDWKGVKEARFDSAAHIAFGRKHWNNASDASFSVRCNYTSKNVYLAIHVEDEYFACTTKTSKRDRLELVFGRRKLTLMPGDLKKIRGRVLLGRRKAKGVVMAEAKRKKGWAVELKLPKRRIPGYRPGAEGIHLELRLVDVDWRGKTDTVITSGKSRLVVAQVVADLQALLKAMNAAPADVRMRKQADLVGGRGVEQLLWIRKAIAMVGPDIPGGGGYFYFQLPVREIKDIKSIRLLDLNGDGKKEIVVKLIQKGAGGWRALLVVYRFSSANKFGRQFAVEVSKGQGSRMIDNRVTFKRRKKRRRKPGGVDIVLDNATSRGFTEQNYRETPADDVHTIMLPWGGTKKRVVRFEEDEYSIQ